MPSTGLEVIDRTVQTTNIWLSEIQEEIGPDRKRAYHALRAVLHALRDRLSPEQAAHLAAQMPLLVRGVFFESWRPAGKPERVRSLDEFLARVDDELKGIRPTGADAAARAVLRTLSRHISPGEIDQIRATLPQEIQNFWLQAERSEQG